MMTKDKRNNSPSAGSFEPHHGDLRKAAYLRRRAVYQMQAGCESGPAAQAGSLTAKGKNTT